jgi:hypothetical protein
MDLEQFSSEENKNKSFHNSTIFHIVNGVVSTAIGTGTVFTLEAATAYRHAAESLPILRDDRHSWLEKIGTFGIEQIHCLLIDPSRADTFRNFCEVSSINFAGRVAPLSVITSGLIFLAAHKIATLISENRQN